MKILYGPPVDSTRSIFFRDEVLHADLSVNGRTLYLVPTNRKRTQILTAFAEESGGLPPRIKTFELLAEFLYRFHGGPARLISRAETHLIIRDLVSRMDPEAKPGLFMEAARHISELRRSGRSSGNLFQLLDAPDNHILYRVTRQYEEILETGNLQDPGGLIPWMLETFRNGSTSDPGFPGYPWQRIVIDGFLDFTEPQTELLRHLGELTETIVFLWPGDPDRPEIYQPALTPFQTCFHPIEWQRNTGFASDDSPLAPLSAAILARRPPVPVPARNTLRILEAGNTREEIIRIARDIKLLLGSSRNGETDAGGICVTFPNLADVAFLIRWIFERYRIPFNISLPLPFHDSPAASAVNVLLEAALDFNRDTLFDLLRHPLLKPPPPFDSFETVALLDKQSRNLKMIGGIGSWLSRLEKNAARFKQKNDPNTAGKLAMLHDGLKTLDSLLSPIRNPRSFRGFLKVLMKLLDSFQAGKIFPETGEPSRIHPADESRLAPASFIKLFTICEELTAGSERGDALQNPPEENRNIWTRIISGEGYQIPTDRSAPVQVLGILETRGLSFNHIYIGGLSENTFPSGEQPSVFLDTPEWNVLLGREGSDPMYQAGTDLIRLLESACRTVTVSWPRMEGDAEIPRSVLIDDLLNAVSDVEIIPTPPEPMCLFDDLIERGAGWRSGVVESLPDGESYQNMIDGAAAHFDRSLDREPYNGMLTGSRARELLNRRLSAKPALSASRIETYLNCPMQFFLGHLCRLELAEEPTEEMEPVLRGQFIHRVLHRFYFERITRGSGRIRADEIEQATRRLHVMAREVFDEIGDENEFALRELRTVTGDPESDYSGLAARFAELEASLPEPLEPGFLEENFRIDLESVEIQGKIDRIDRCGGSAVVYDYKTGSVEIDRALTGWMASDEPACPALNHIQIGLYLLAVQTLMNLVPAGGFFYQVSRRDGCRIVPVVGLETETALDGLFSDRQRFRMIDRSRLDAYLERVKATCIRVSEMIQSGYFKLADDEKSCTFCPYFQICRIRERNRVKLEDCHGE
ncbi:PD-(D/E)XK nuclease family protein [bacterium]|nr:PD-(D/E)XK nuclease family protein [candidate division CSSED10-310 bacterium]